MTASSPATVAVYVIDNNDTPESWADRLRQAPDAARGRDFAIFEQVTPTVRSARALLRAAISDRALPELVVIDHHLGATRDLAETGLGVMRWFRDACAQAQVSLPKCVLWSAEYSEGLAYTFHQSKGRAAFPRTLPSPEFVEQLWRVLDDTDEARHGYVHPWRGAPLKLGPSVAACLPCFEEDLGTHGAAELLVSRGVIGPEITDPHLWVNDQRRRLMAECNRVARQLYGTAPFYRGQEAKLAQFALEHGRIWIPLRYEEEPQ